MKNMKNLIKQHNARLLRNQEHTEKRSCTCSVVENCSLGGKCLHKCICVKRMSLPTMNVKNTLELLKENLNLAIIATP